MIDLLDEEGIITKEEVLDRIKEDEWEEEMKRDMELIASSF